jgi:chaperonin GroEL (HSP60 family)
MTGKAGESYSDLLADIAVDAVLAVEDNGSVNVDDNIKMMKKVGLRTEKTELIRGIVIDKKRAHPQMPKRVKNAKIAVLSKGIEAKKVDLPKAKMKIEDPNELESFLKEEEIVIEETVKELADAGVNVVFTEKGIDDTGKHFLIKYGIMGVERVSSGDIKKISRATGARVISNTKDISPDDLGEASIVEEVGEEEKELIYIRDAKNTKAITIVIHAGTEQIAEEVERMLDDAVRVVACVVEDGYIVAGGGAPEVELALQLREYANTLKGREQLAVDAFANSLEVIPRTLAENAGLDPIDKLVELRSAHEKGMVTAGLDVYTGEVVDMWEMGVVEPLKVKTQAIASATEAAVMILRIDDVLASKPPEEEEKEEEEEKPPSFTGEEFGGGDFGGF